MRKSVIALMTALMSVSLFASIVTPLDVAGTIENVKVAKRISVTNDAEKKELNLFGAGLRVKKILFAEFKVYVASIYLGNTQNVSRTDDQVMTSLKTNEDALVQLSFLRNVEAEKVQASFKDALIANGVNVEDKNIVDFLKVVTAGGAASEGKTLTISLSRKNGDQTAMRYEDNSGKVQTLVMASTDFENIISIWLGKPADAGLVKLKDQILKGM